MTAFSEQKAMSRNITTNLGLSCPSRDATYEPRQRQGVLEFRYAEFVDGV